MGFKFKLNKKYDFIKTKKNMDHESLVRRQS